jgi:hypothetical protein
MKTRITMQTIGEEMRTANDFEQREIFIPIHNPNEKYLIMGKSSGYLSTALEKGGLIVVANLGKHIDNDEFIQALPATTEGRSGGMISSLNIQFD